MIDPSSLRKREEAYTEPLCTEMVDLEPTPNVPLEAGGINARDKRVRHVREETFRIITQLLWFFLSAGCIW